MIRCLAIDDEPLALRQLSAYIKRVPFLELTAVCQSASEARTVMERQKVDAMFIDINMPDLNGLDFVRQLAVRPIVVFTTAYSDYAIEGYKVNAADYLLKPFSYDDFLRSAERVRQRYDIISRAESGSHEGGKGDSLFFKVDHRNVRVSLHDIIYIEGMSEYVRIHLREGKPLIVLMAMKRLEETLPRDMFMRIHRSYIINLSEVKMTNKTRVTLNDGTSLPIGDFYRDAFTAYINGTLMSK